MKIVCLCENTPYSKEFYYEHGLSLYIETNNKKILFDMGQSDVFCKNADLLGLDLSTVDIAILSHAHYDHGGGIQKFLALNKKAKIYMSKYALEDYYNGKEKYIGLDKSLVNNERFILCENYLKLDEGLELFSKNEDELIVPIDSAGLNVKKENEFIADKFIHEQYLRITEDEKTYLFSGCSHKGILNIVNWFNPNVLIGGFHLKKQEANKSNPVLENIVKQLNQYNTIYYTCHCTGLEQYKILKESMTDNLYYISSGQKIEL